MVDPDVLELARRGENPTCVGCGNPSMGGGLHCLGCFHLEVAPPKPHNAARPPAVGRLRHVRLPAHAGRDGRQDAA